MIFKLKSQSAKFFKINIASNNMAYPVQMAQDYLMWIFTENITVSENVRFTNGLCQFRCFGQSQDK